MSRAQYRRLLTQAYDIDKPEPPPDELAYYRSLAEVANGPLLEVMCGSGRFLLPLLEAGVDIDGIDASEDMLSACRDKGGHAVAGRIHHQDLVTMDLPRRYDLVFCGGGSFGLLETDDDVRRALTACRHHLLPGGRLVLEVETPAQSGRPGSWSGRWWTRPDGAVIVSRGLYGGLDGSVERALGIYELFVDGTLVETELDEWVRRFWTREAMVDAVTAAGFEQVRVTTAFATTGPEDDDGMISVVATRPRR